MNLLPRWIEKAKSIQVNGSIFVLSILSGFICHAYCMVNLIGTEDTLGDYSDGSINLLSTFAGADTGRWLSGFVNRIQGWYRTPMLSGCIIILIMAVMAQLVICFFQIRSTAGMIFIAILLEVTSPAQSYMTLYEVGYPLSALLAVLAAYFLSKARTVGKKYWIYATICECVALCILPVNISCTLTLLLMLLLFHAVDPAYSVSRRSEWRWIACCLCSLAVSGAFLLVSSRLLMSWFTVAQTSYQGAEAAMNGSFIGSIGANYFHSFVKLFIMGIWKLQTLPTFRFTYYVCYVLDLICTLGLLRRCRNKGRRFVQVLTCLALLPVAVCTMSLVSYGFMYRGQHRQALLLFVLGTIPLVELFLSVGRGQKERLQRTVYMILTGNLALMCISSVLFDNIGYFNQHHAMVQDRSLCTRILSALDQTEGFNYDQPVYFLNLLSWESEESPTPLRYDPELYSVIWPVATTNLYAYGDASFRIHMRSLEGVEFQRPARNICEAVENSDLKVQYDDMRSGDFEIVRYENTWVVVVRTIGPINVLYG